MNEQALQDAYTLFTENGYNGSLDEFKNLMSTNDQALNDAYTLFNRGGYDGSIEQFSSLIGVGEIEPDKIEEPEQPKDFTKDEIIGNEATEASIDMTEMPPPKTPEVQEVDPFDNSLDVINNEMIGSIEENVVPEFNYHFNQHGFEATKTSIGDAMRVKAKNGKEIVVDLDPDINLLGFRLLSRDQKKTKESEALRKFLKENRVDNERLLRAEKNYKKSEVKFRTDEDVKLKTDEFNKETELFKEELNQYLKETQNYKALKEKFRSMSQEEINLNPQEYLDYLEEGKRLQNRKAELFAKEDEFRVRGKQLDAIVGEYTSMKANQGTFLGAAYNKFIEGFDMYQKDIVSTFIDIGVELDGKRYIESSPKEFIGVALKKGFITEKDLDGNVSIESIKEKLSDDQIKSVNSYMLDMAKKEMKYDLVEMVDVFDSNGKPLTVNGEKIQIKKPKNMVNPYSSAVTNQNYEGDLGMLDAVGKGLKYALGDSDTTAEFEDLKMEGFWGGAILGLSQSIPAMLGPGGKIGWAFRTAKMFGQTSSFIKDEMATNPEFAEISENEKLLISVPLGIVTAGLEAFGLRNILKSKGIITSIALKALNKTPKGASAKTFQQIVQQEIKSAKKRFLLTAGAAGLAEFETGFLQEGADISIKNLYNIFKEKEMFQTPESMRGAFQQMLRGGAQEAVGGFILGSLPGIASAANTYDFTQLDKTTFLVLEDILKSEKSITDYRTFFVQDIKNKMVNGELSKKEGQERLDAFDKVAEVYSQIPNDLNTEGKREALGLLLRKKELQNDIQNKDPNLVKSKINEINEINKQLDNIVKADQSVKVEKEEKKKIIDTIKSKKPLTEKQKEIAEFFGIDTSTGNEIQIESEDIIINKKEQKDTDAPVVGLGLPKIKALAMAGLKAAKTLVPDLNVVIHSDSDLFNEARGSKSIAEFDLETKTIHIDASKAKLTTIPHELFHAVLIEKVGPQTAAITKKMMEAINKTPLSKVTKDKIEKFAAQYDMELQNEEQLAELTGILAAEFDTLTKPQKNIVLQFIKDIGVAIGFKMDFINQLTSKEEGVVDLLNTLSRKFRTGEVVTQEDVEILDKLSPKEMTFAQYLKRQTRQQKDVVAAEEFNLDDLEVISKGGSGRIVYQHPDPDKVIKVATSPRGLEQNLSVGFGDFDILGGQIAELFDKGLDYIVVEKVPRNDKVANAFLKPLKKFTPLDFKRMETALVEQMEDMGLSDFRNYNLLWNDFTAGRNWGVRADGEVVLVDEGALNDSVFYGSEISNWAKQDWEQVKTKRRNVRQQMEIDFDATETQPTPPTPTGRPKVVRLKSEEDIFKSLNFNNRGFITAPSEADLNYVKSRLPEGYTARRARRDAFGRGGGVMVFKPNGRRLMPTRRQQLETPDDAEGPVSEMTLDEYVKQARDAGFTDARIKDFLVNVIQRFKPGEVNKALETTVPKNFANMKGGVKAAKKLLQKVKAFQTKLINRNSKKKNPDSDAVIADKVIEYMESQPEFKKESDKQKALMLNEMQVILEGNPTATMATRLRKLRLIASGMVKGQRTLQELKRDLKNYMRRHLPKSLYTKSETMALVKELERATDSNIDNVISKINDLVIKKNVEILNKNITDILKDTFTRVTSGLRKGVKISNKARKVIDRIKELSLFGKNPTTDQIITKKQDLLKKFDEINAKETLTEADLNELVELQTALSLLEAQLLDDNNANKAETLSRVNQTLLDIIERGKSELAVELEKAHQTYKQDMADSFYDITGTKVDINDPDFDTTVKAVLETLKAKKNLKNKQTNRLIKGFKAIGAFIDKGIKRSEALDGLIDRLSKLPGVMFGGRLQELVTDRIDAATIIFKRRRMEMEKMLQNKLEELYGKNWRREARRMRMKIDTGIKLETDLENLKEKAKKNPTPKNKQAYEEALAAQETQFMSPNQMYYLYNQYKDPKNHPKFKAKFGKDYKEVMAKIENILETKYPKLKAFADWQVNELLPTLYDYYNEVYKKIYRTDMPWNQNYAGRLYTKAVDDTPLNLLGGNGMHIGSSNVTGKSTHERNDNNSPILIKDGTDALFTYLNDMEYFAAYAEPLNFISKIFSNKQIKDAIEILHGKDMNKLINTILGRVATRGTESPKMAAIVNMFNNIFIVSRLALSPVITIKQLISLFTYANDIGIKNWVLYSMKNLPQVVKTWKEIRDNSVYMQDRKYNSIMRTIESYTDENMISFIPGDKKQFFLNFLMWTTKFGDRSAIMLGGMANYNYYKEQYRKKNPKASEQEVIDYAIKKFEKDTKRTQQSGDIQDKDYFQTADPWYRAFNMFLTTPKQYMRKEIIAARQLFRMMQGKDYKGTFKQNIRTFAMYHFIMPMIFQYVSMGLPGLLRGFRDDDDEDLLRAAALGNLNAFFILGEIFVGIADAIQGKPWGFQPKSIGIFETTDRIIKKWDKWAQATKQLEKYRSENSKKVRTQQEKVDKLLMEAIAETTTVGPSAAPTLLKWWYNLGELDNPNIPPGEAILRLLNYSDYTIKGPKTKEKKGKKKIPLRDLKILDPEEYNRIQREKELRKQDPRYLEEQRRKKYERLMYEQQLRDRRR